jgi:uncharacterized membrane protein
MSKLPQALPQQGPAPIPSASTNLSDDAPFDLLRQAWALQIANWHAVADPQAEWNREAMQLSQSWVHALDAGVKDALKAESLADLAVLPMHLWTRLWANWAIHSGEAMAHLTVSFTPPLWADLFERSLAGANPAEAVA